MFKKLARFNKVSIPTLITALVMLARMFELFDMPTEAQAGLTAFLTWLIPNSEG